MNFMGTLELMVIIYKQTFPNGGTNLSMPSKV
jgi:hypothetical protein